MLKKYIPIRSYTGEKWMTNPTNKKYLAIDFRNRCAYCDDLDYLYGGKRSFAVEHFAPKDKFPELKFTYDNLLYACPYCNGAKGNDWPSKSSKINIVNDCGYVDPCSENYYKHLDRNEKTGEIFPTSKLGEYMYSHLNLGLVRHKILYMIDKLNKEIADLEKSIESDKSNGLDADRKQELLNVLDREFRKYYCELQTC